MVCTFIKAHENKKELYLALTIELQNNNISYSNLVCMNKVFRVKAECSKSEILAFDISQSLELREYGELKCSGNSGLENLLGSFNFKIDDEFLRGHFENILRMNDLPVIRNIEVNSYRVKNRNVWFVENELNIQIAKLEEYNILVYEDSKNNYVVQKLI